jgi:hypothetical protein
MNSSARRTWRGAMAGGGRNSASLWLCGCESSSVDNTMPSSADIAGAGKSASALASTAASAAATGSQAAHAGEPRAMPRANDSGVAGR